jgi:hypothetical protein
MLILISLITDGLEHLTRKMKSLPQWNANRRNPADTRMLLLSTTRTMLSSDRSRVEAYDIGTQPEGMLWRMYLM